MLDANGREVRIGDTVATPLPHLEELQDIELVVRLPELIAGAILGTVMEFGEDFQGEFVYLEGYGDGIVYGPEDIATLGGLEFVTCPECGDSWVFDVRMNTEEECPYCDTAMGNPAFDWELDENLEAFEQEEAEYREAFEGCFLDLGISEPKR